MNEDRRYLNIEDRSQMDEQRMDDLLLEDAYARRSEVIDTLTYNNYRWQREFYGLAADRLAKVYPRADKYEECYQEELRRRAA